MTDEEIKLWDKIKSGDKDAIDEIYNRNTALVKFIARRYFHYNKDFEFNDVLQNGYLGLLKAIKSFKPEMDFAFSSYAGIIINFGILQGLRKEKLILVPYEARDTCKISDKDFLSLDLIVSKKDENMTIADTIPSNEIPVDKLLELSENSDALAETLLRLTPTEKTIIEMRYGLIDNKYSTVAECAEHLNIGWNTAHQLEDKAIQTLRQILKEKYS